MEKIISESDSNELKTARAATTSPETLIEDSTSDTVEATSGKNVPLFEVAGAVSPSDATEGATMPPHVETRGRHKLGCTCDKCRAKGKTSSTKKGKAAKADDAVPDHIQAAILYNFILVRGCKMISPEYDQGEQLQAETLKAATEYFESQDIKLPPWVGLAAVTLANIAVATSTPSGKGRMSNAWEKIKIAYVKWRG